MENKVAVITGAASGIGLAVAKSLAASGHLLALVDKDSQIQNLVEDLHAPKGSKGFVVDLANPSQVREFVETIKTTYPSGIDILVNNAGVHPKKEGRKPTIQEISDEQWHTVLAINLTAPFLIFRELFDLLKLSKAGRVINVASRAGRAPSPVAAAHYATTKTGLIGLTRVMALEGAPFGITANCVAPGPILTALTGGSSEEVRAALTKSIPLGRYGNPEEVASAITYLASEQASYVTGAVFDVNGGTYMP